GAERRRRLPHRVESQPLLDVVIGAAPLAVDVVHVDDVASAADTVIIAAVGVERAPRGEDRARLPAVGETASRGERKDIRLRRAYGLPVNHRTEAGIEARQRTAEQVSGESVD